MLAVGVVLVVAACAARMASAGDQGQRLAVVKVLAAAPTWVDTGVDIEAGMADPVSVTGTVFTAPAALYPADQSPGSGRQASSGASGSIITCLTGCYLDIEKKLTAGADPALHARPEAGKKK